MGRMIDSKRRSRAIRRAWSFLSYWQGDHSWNLTVRLLWLFARLQGWPLYLWCSCLFFYRLVPRWTVNQAVDFVFLLRVSVFIVFFKLVKAYNAHKSTVFPNDFVIPIISGIFIDQGSGCGNRRSVKRCSCSVGRRLRICFVHVNLCLAPGLLDSTSTFFFLPITTPEPGAELVIMRW